MPATSAPFGLRPVHDQGGIIRPVAMTIASAYNTDIYQNQPVTIAADGTITATAVGGRFIGVFQGVEWTDSEGRRRVSNRWTANTVATDVVAYVTRDPMIIYEIQTNATVALATIGGQYDFTAASGNTTTGLSSQMLDVASVAANASLQILNVANGVDNAFGDNFVVVRVRISEHQLVADVAQF